MHENNPGTRARGRTQSIPPSRPGREELCRRNAGHDPSRTLRAERVWIE